MITHQTENKIGFETNKFDKVFLYVRPKIASSTCTYFEAVTERIVIVELLVTSFLRGEYNNDKEKIPPFNIC